MLFWEQHFSHERARVKRNTVAPPKSILLDLKFYHYRQNQMKTLTMIGIALTVKNQEKLFYANPVHEYFTRNVPKRIILIKMRCGNVHPARYVPVVFLCYQNLKMNRICTL